MRSKICARCHIEFHYTYRHGKERWEKQKYCSKKCNAKTLKEWFEIHFQKSKGCWNWEMNFADDGYGAFNFSLAKGLKKNMKAHRFSYELYKEKIPKEYVIDHICRNRACVNPDHLRAVTRSVNSLENSLGLGAMNKLKLQCKRGHEFTKENTFRNGKEGHRGCKTCRILLDRAKYLKNRDKYIARARIQHEKARKKRLNRSS